MKTTKRSGTMALRGRSRAARPRRRWLAAGVENVLPVAAYLMLLGLVGGGVAEWSAGYALLMAATIAFSALFVWRGGLETLARLPWTARAALIGIGVLPLLQLVPLPPAMWQALPGQTLRLATLTQAGIADTWQPLTLEPVGTALIAVLAVGFTALVGSLLQLTDAQFRTTMKLALGLVLLGIAIGLLQVVSNGQPHLQVDNMGGTMLGVFANKNHMAMVLACSILIFGLIVNRDMFGRDKRKAVTIGYVLFAFICIVTTNSRAGLGLGLLAAAIVMADLARDVALRWRIAGVTGIAVLLVVLWSTSAFELVFSRVGEVDDDLRWQIAIWSWPLAERYATTGSGFGSFETLFAANEQLAWVKPTFVNAAHNDYLQLLIEAGLVGVLVLALLLAAVAGSVSAYLKTPRRDPRRMEMGAGLAMVTLFALHSGFDYPLRRPATWIFFALALAALFRGYISQRVPSSEQVGRPTDPA